MARSRSRRTDSSDSGVPHLASRIEDAIHDFRERWARRRGHTPTVIPYAGYGSAGWVRVLGRVLLSKPGSSTRHRKIRGWRSFTSVPLNDIAVTVTIGTEEHPIVADRGGVIDAVIDASLSPGWHSIQISVDGGGTVEASVFIVDPDVKLGLISDIDDTVMVTALPRPFVAAWNTFVLDEHARRPVPGMAVLYERILHGHPGAPCIYLSTGAWNVAPTLNRFLNRHLFPRGPLLLTDWGPTRDRWFRSGRLHKEDTLRRLAQEFPQIRWILVGDDGQHDPEIYRRFIEEHPGQVEAVAIRQLTTGEAVLAGGRNPDDDDAAAVGAVPWHHAPDGAGLAKKLLGAGSR